MKNPTMRFIAYLAILTASAALVVPCPAAPRGQMANPDFTKGESIPEGANHDWNLGATGARGWMFSNRLETTEARQIAITKVDKGSPADGVLKVGDVILGVGGKPFSMIRASNSARRSPSPNPKQAREISRSPAGGTARRRRSS